ncbi:type IV secretion system DNA-binding domain-containing protein [Colwellia sp. BRX10-4]|jgi:hypothetical protein|uniref:type IV secretion system DNA-binding domain-containing protein n=1 Tax=Colwellia sp. BRX10-4 TaxID=2759843 RepID=UPI0015F749D3|nr:type IV secretion system DNA-binding domain-containing protein [Colwellia sp. BRX10-4]MBA6397674.1 type IV secretion system DNA-binding domain-containing protein [Colwellia sp. BRX10-4]
MLLTRQSKWLQHCAVALALTTIFSLVSVFTFVLVSKTWSEFNDLLLWCLTELLPTVFLYQYFPSYGEISKQLEIALKLIPVFSLSISSFIVWFFRIRRNKASIYHHLDGPQLLDGKKAINHFKKLVKCEDSTGLKLHNNMPLPMLRELQNFLIHGMQGSGKSNLIKYHLQQIIIRGDKTLIYDIKGEYTELFYDERTTLISVYDARSAVWNISQDINSLAMAELFTEAVLTEGSGNESFWINSARAVLKGVIAGLVKRSKKWGWLELNRVLFSSDEELHQWLSKYYVQASGLIKPEDKTSASIRAVIASQLPWIGEVSELWKNTEISFSLKQWLNNNDKPTLIIQGDLNAPTLSSALITAMMSVTTGLVLSRPDNGNERIWLVLDELGNLNKSQSLTRVLSLGRSKGVCTIAGTQSLSQIQSIYGDKEAETILSLFGNVIALKLGPSGGSAESASQSLGKRRVEYITKSRNEKGEITHSLQQESMAIVPPEAIIHLPQPTKKYGVDGYVLLSGLNAVYKVHWPIYTNFKKVAEARIEKIIKPTTIKKKNRLSRKKAS